MAKAKPDIKPDPRNFRVHSDRNKALIKKSLKELGAARSIVLDQSGTIVAGNGVHREAVELGIPVRIIPTDGSELIAIQRTDLKPDSKKRKQLALADNAISDTSEFDFELLQTEFEPVELQEWGIEVLGPESLGTDFTLPNGDRAPFQKMTFTLADEQAEFIKKAITEIKQSEGYKNIDSDNENSNGNALFLIVSEWEGQRK